MGPDNVYLAAMLAAVVGLAIWGRALPRDRQTGAWTVHVSGYVLVASALEVTMLWRALQPGNGLLLVLAGLFVAPVQLILLATYALMVRRARYAVGRGAILILGFATLSAGSFGAVMAWTGGRGLPPLS